MLPILLKSPWHPFNSTAANRVLKMLLSRSTTVASATLKSISLKTTGVSPCTRSYQDMKLSDG